MRGRRGEVGKQSRNPFLYDFDFRAGNRDINLLICAFATGMNLPPLPHALQGNWLTCFMLATCLI